MRQRDPTADEVISVLRTAPRSTTSQLSEAIAEDLGVRVTSERLRELLNALCEDGLIARHDRNAKRRGAGFVHFVWWVP